MCLFDQTTGERVRDCQTCYCGTSSNVGNHRYEKTGQIVAINGVVYELERCNLGCGQYK